MQLSGHICGFTVYDLLIKLTCSCLDTYEVDMQLSGHICGFTVYDLLIKLTCSCLVTYGRVVVVYSFEYFIAQVMLARYFKSGTCIELIIN